MAKKENQPEPRSFNQDELGKLRELHRICTSKRFEAEQVKLNTLLIPRGQEIAAELEAMAKVYENFRTNWLAQTITECGWPQGQKVSVDLQTGVITPNES